MKHLLYVVAIALCLAACKKELGACTEAKEVNTDQTLDPAGIGLKAFRDTLAKYPQLKPSSYWSSPYSASMACYMYYKDLIVFSDIVSFYKESSTDTIRQSGTIIPSELGISLSPGLSYEKALENARKYVNFDHACISYRLGLFHVDPYGSKNNYRLAWKIMRAEAPHIFVISDAASNQVYQTSNGMYWIN